MQDQRMKDIIDLAIQREKEAYAFYKDIQQQVNDDAIKDSIEFIAEEEKKHREFLENYRDGKFGVRDLRMTDVTYYQIAEHQKEPETVADLKREDVFLVAAHRELKSYHFYTEMAQLHQAQEELKELLKKIANEELRHKEKMEYLYANTAFPQTSGG